MPLGVTDRLGGSREAVRRDDARAASLTNSSGPPKVTASSPGCMSHRDVGLRAARGVELERVEPDDDEPEQVHLEVHDRCCRALNVAAAGSVRSACVTTPSIVEHRLAAGVRHEQARRDRTA